MADRFLTLVNAGAAPLAELPELSFEEFRSALLGRSAAGDRLSAFFALPEPGTGFRLVAVLADDATGKIRLCSARTGFWYNSLTPECAAFHWFEREIAEQYGIVPEGHPWLKPIRFHRSRTPGVDAWGRSPGEILPGVADYFRPEGAAVHEVAVGPVHAGVIEPGHFRFQCFGEKVCSLEISLGYQHRGIETLLENGPDRRTMHYFETAAGDSSIAEAVAGAGILEAFLPELSPSPDALRIRGIALELERVANHVGDLGALAGDVAFLPTAAFCGRIRGEYLNMTAEICGNRFGRGLTVPGGVRYAIDEKRAARLCERLDRVEPDLDDALELLFDSPSVLDRFENTGMIASADAEKIGMVGVAARACSLTCDIRHSHPGGIYTEVPPPERALETAGDTLARAKVRRTEVKASCGWIRKQLETAPDNPGCPEPLPARLPADSIAVSLTEAWRGELCHVAITGPDGRFRRYKIVDPSFHNWFGLALALRGEQISNFPICNKSFNLSYCGHDL